MKISGCEAFIVALPWRRLHKMAFPSGELGNYVIVRVFTDDGIEGLGRGDRHQGVGRRLRALLRRIAGAHGAADRDRPRARPWWAATPSTSRPPTSRWTSAVKGYPYAKTGAGRGAPRHQGQGARRPRVPVARRAVPGGDRRRAQPGLARVRRGHQRRLPPPCRRRHQDDQDQGRARSPSTTSESCARSARRSAPDPDIVVDANQGWPTPKYAIGILARMEEYARSAMPSSRSKASARWPR